MPTTLSPWTRTSNKFNLSDRFHPLDTSFESLEDKVNETPESVNARPMSYFAGTNTSLMKLQASKLEG